MKGKCPLFACKEKYACGDLTFRSTEYDFFDYIVRRKNVDADGLFDVVAHGSPNSIKIEHNGKGMTINARTLARIIKKNPRYKKQGIRLISCSTGSLPNGFAQNLANKLGVVVHAPDKLCWSNSHGNYWVAARSKTNPEKPSETDLGSFIKFYPGGNRI